MESACRCRNETEGVWVVDARGFLAHLCVRSVTMVLPSAARARQLPAASEPEARIRTPQLPAVSRQLTGTTTHGSGNVGVNNLPKVVMQWQKWRKTDSISQSLDHESSVLTTQPLRPTYSFCVSDLISQHYCMQFYVNSLHAVTDSFHGRV